MSTKTAKLVKWVELHVTCWLPLTKKVVTPSDDHRPLPRLQTRSSWRLCWVQRIMLTVVKNSRTHIVDQRNCHSSVGIIRMKEALDWRYTSYKDSEVQPHWVTLQSLWASSSLCVHLTGEHYCPRLYVGTVAKEKVNHKEQQTNIHTYRQTDRQTIIHTDI